MIKFPHIHLFRNVLAYVENVNNSIDVPAMFRVGSPVTFKGTIKLHGSNCGVVLDVATDTLQAQSREINLTPKEDYKGFAKFVVANETQIRDIFTKIRKCSPLIGAGEQVALYGEWIGPGVVAKTKGVAVAKFEEKHWALFAVAYRLPDVEEAFLEPDILDDFELTPRIGCVRKAGDWTLTVDFNDPVALKAAQEEATRITESIEAQCPYGALYGLKGHGEGIVWMPTGEFEGRAELYWKHKTKAHSVSRETKVAKVKPVIPAEVQEAIRDFVDATVTDNRLDQGIDALEQQGIKAEKRNTGCFIKWVSDDVQRECALELEDTGLTWKQVTGAVTTKARGFFLTHAN